jgi:predicted transcriptional regulator
MKTKESKESQMFRVNYEKLMKSKRTYVGLVPVLEDGELSAQARILFHIISSFSYVDGFCYATKTLSEKLGLGQTAVKKYVAELEEKGLTIHKIGITKRGIRREIYINFDAIEERYVVNDKKTDGL